LLGSIIGPFVGESIVFLLQKREPPALPGRR
jgi:hypothetical protein